MGNLTQNLEMNMNNLSRILGPERLANDIVKAIPNEQLEVALRYIARNHGIPWREEQSWSPPMPEKIRHRTFLTMGRKPIGRRRF